MDIKDLPKPGINFRATRAAGAGSLQAKLSSATRYGNLKNLRDNQKVIVDTIKNPTIQRAIRRGGLSRLQQRSAWLKMRAKDKTITKEDKREIKELLKYLGRGSVANKPSSKTDRSIEVRSGAERPIFKFDGSLVNGKIFVINGKKVFKSNKQIAANLARNRDIDDSYFTEGNNGKKSMNFASAVGKTYNSRDKGSAQDLEIKKIKTGFAANYNNKNLPNSSAPKTSLGGSRPIGL
ncbi:MAG: hypothetical protein WC422_05090 [Candidatus Paceibacterota bacterium]|jgi:hypothetical protein